MFSLIITLNKLVIAKIKKLTLIGFLSEHRSWSCCFLLLNFTESLLFGKLQLSSYPLPFLLLFCPLLSCYLSPHLSLHSASTQLRALLWLCHAQRKFILLPETQVSLLDLQLTPSHLFNFVSSLLHSVSWIDFLTQPRLWVTITSCIFFFFFFFY